MRLIDRLLRAWDQWSRMNYVDFDLRHRTDGRLLVYRVVANSGSY